MRTYKSKFLTLVSVAVVSSVLTMLLMFGTSNLGARPQQYTGQENHVISLDQAVKYVQNFKNFPRTPAVKGGYFGRNIFEKMLSQAGCVGIRYYYGQDDNGASNIVLVGVDAGGNDMTSGIMADISWPCPPYCPAPNPLTR
jgi:hypothetical protein